MNGLDRKLYLEACRKISGYPVDVLLPSPVFKERAVEWLVRIHGTIEISRDEWNDERTQVIEGYYTVRMPELDGTKNCCFGDTLADALISAIDISEVPA